FFVEVSPHPVLSSALHETLEHATGDRPGNEAIVVGSLRRDEGHLARLLLSLTELHTGGHRLDWPGFFRPYAPRRVSLPTYPFQRERFWLDAPKDRKTYGFDVREQPVRRTNGHPLLGERTRSSLEAGITYWSEVLSLRTTKYLAQHRVAEQVVFPGAGYIE